MMPIVATNPVAETVDAFTGKRTESTDVGFGLGLQFRLGLEFASGLSIALNFGGTISGMNRELATGTRTDANRTLLTSWFGTSVRYNFVNDSALLPFLGGGVSLFGVDACRTGGSLCRLNAAFASNLSAGIIYALSPILGMEVGVQGTLLLPNEQFGDTEFLVFPFVGITSTSRSLSPVRDSDY